MLLSDVILFLAELFQQLEIQVKQTKYLLLLSLFPTATLPTAWCVQVGAVVQRVAVLGDAIPQLLTTLASQPDKENVKCIVQTLKCAGSVLEEEEGNKAANKGATPLMDATVETLDTLSRDPELEPALAEMLQSLVKLRKSNWGHSPPGSVAGAGQLQM